MDGFSIRRNGGGSYPATTQQQQQGVSSSTSQQMRPQQLQGGNISKREVFLFLGKKFFLIFYFCEFSGQKPFQCRFCERRFVENASLKAHIRTHTGQKPFVCNICGAQFFSGEALHSHKAKHLNHIKEQGRRLGYADINVCVVCGKKFGGELKFRVWGPKNLNLRTPRSFPFPKSCHMNSILKLFRKRKILERSDFNFSVIDTGLWSL